VQQNAKMSAALFSRFDLVFAMVDSADEELDRHLSEHVMRVHCDGEILGPLLPIHTPPCLDEINTYDFFKSWAVHGLGFCQYIIVWKYSDFRGSDSWTRDDSLDLICDSATTASARENLCMEWHSYSIEKLSFTLCS
jgi:hypothetical protein